MLYAGGRINRNKCWQIHKKCTTMPPMDDNIWQDNCLADGYKWKSVRLKLSNCERLLFVDIYHC